MCGGDSVCPVPLDGTLGNVADGLLGGADTVAGPLVGPLPEPLTELDEHAAITAVAASVAASPTRREWRGFIPITVARIGRRTALIPLGRRVQGLAA
jgi:hypothetical protein